MNKVVFLLQVSIFMFSSLLSQPYNKFINCRNGFISLSENTSTWIDHSLQRIAPATFTIQHLTFRQACEHRQKEIKRLELMLNTK